MNNSAIDARAQFRLNGMDLGGTGAAERRPAAHWILKYPRLRAWVADVEKAFQRLIDTGFEPFEGQPVSPAAVIDALGFWNYPEPQRLIGHAKFTALMLAATSREGLRIEREIAWLKLNRAPTK
jgi:hypothetical protein